MTKNLKRVIVILCVLAITLYVLFGILKVQDKVKQIMYPKKYEEIVCKYAENYGVDDSLIYAIIKAESNFKETAVSSKGATGLMQLMYETAQDVSKILGLEIDEESLLEPDVNINLGTKYISILISKYNNIPLALAAYNAGSGNVDNWIEKGIIQNDGSDIENIPYKETNNYVRKILRDYAIYN